MKCYRRDCDEDGIVAFSADPEEMLCQRHFDKELKRRIAALDAAKGMFIALIDNPTEHPYDDPFFDINRSE